MRSIHTVQNISKCFSFQAPNSTILRFIGFGGLQNLFKNQINYYIFQSLLRLSRKATKSCTQSPDPKHDRGMQSHSPLQNRPTVTFPQATDLPLPMLRPSGSRLFLIHALGQFCLPGKLGDPWDRSKFGAIMTQTKGRSGKQCAVMGDCY